ncbi:hypothetical protein D3C75_1237320 [compost metagenome]
MLMGWLFRLPESRQTVIAEVGLTLVAGVRISYDRAKTYKLKEGIIHGGTICCGRRAADYSQDSSTQKEVPEILAATNHDGAGNTLSDSE